MQDEHENLIREITTGESWLTSYPSPEPEAALVEKIKGAMWLEHCRVGMGDAKPWAVWQGVLAAVASIALAVTVSWRSSLLLNQSATDVEVAEADLVWLNQTGQQASVLADLDQGLSDLESWSSNDAWNLNGVKLYEAIQSLPDDSVEGAGKSGAMLVPQRDSWGSEVLS